VLDRPCIEAFVEIVIMTEVDKIGQHEENSYNDEIDEPYPFSHRGTNEIQKRDPRQDEHRQADHKRKAKIEPEAEIECPKNL
jgi:hypothetical protein